MKYNTHDTIDSKVNTNPLKKEYRDEYPWSA